MNSSSKTDNDKFFEDLRLDAWRFFLLEHMLAYQSPQTVSVLYKSWQGYDKFATSHGVTAEPFERYYHANLVAEHYCFKESSPVRAMAPSLFAGRHIGWRKSFYVFPEDIGQFLESELFILFAGVEGYIASFVLAALWRSISELAKLKCEEHPPGSEYEYPWKDDPPDRPFLWPGSLDHLARYCQTTLLYEILVEGHWPMYPRCRSKYPEELTKIFKEVK